jgi:hypothetical protein
MKDDEASGRFGNCRSRGRSVAAACNGWKATVEGVTYPADKDGGDGSARAMEFMGTFSIPAAGITDLGRDGGNLSSCLTAGLV